MSYLVILPDYNQDTGCCPDRSIGNLAKRDGPQWVRVISGTVHYTIYLGLG